MQNLKITLNLRSPFIAHRFLTIDSVLMAQYYSLLARHRKAKGLPPLPMTDSTDEIAKFIHRENGVLSGSVWYIPDGRPLALDFTHYTKKTESDRIRTFAKKAYINESSGEFKAALLEDEVISVPEIYFYIRADRSKIELLLRELVTIGKKGAQGYGEIDAFEIEEIESHKGILLDCSTAAKPLPTEAFGLPSKRIALYRSVPPYWANYDLKPCYMPPTSLVESADEGGKKRGIRVAKGKELSFVSAPRFVRRYAAEYVKAYQGEKIKQDKRKKRWSLASGEGRCAVTGEIVKEGVEGNLRAFFKTTKENFTDFAYLQNNERIGEDAIAVIDSVKELGNSYVDKSGLKYVQGAKAEVRFTDYIEDISRLSPPFVLSLKSTMNTQHVVFKGRVSVSTGMFVVQRGNRTLYVDGELLLEAIGEIGRITNRYKTVSKTHLVGNFGSGSHPPLKRSADREEAEAAIAAFWRKYDAGVREVLFWSKSI